MELRTLKYFLTIVEEGNITRAAEKLCIAQPPLSRQMKLLEEELQVKLFLRGKRQIQLTEAGRLLQQRAAEILFLTERTQQQLGKLSGLEEGMISIGATEACGAGLLSEILYHFHEKFPGIRLQIWSGNGDEVHDRLEKNLVDMGIMRGPFNMEKCDSIFLRSEPWIAVFGKDYPLSGCAETEEIELSCLKDEPLFIPMRESVQEEISDWFNQCFTQKNILCRYSSLTTVIGLVEKNLGVAICPESVKVFTNKEKLNYRKIVHPGRDSRLFLLKKRFQLMPAAAEAFWEFAGNYAEMRA